MGLRKWQVQDAKTDWSALLRAAQEQGPQAITRHGEPVAVVVSYLLYKKLSHNHAARKNTLIEFFSDWPELEIPNRDKNDSGRDINFE